jgi:hypothetical protein
MTAIVWSLTDSFFKIVVMDLEKNTNRLLHRHASLT